MPSNPSGARVTVRRLRCQVRLASQKRESMMGKDAKPVSPSLHFATPPKLTTAAAEDFADDPAMEFEEETSERDARRVDPREVADRVYDLMKREMEMGRDRGELRRR